jgi:hypothetical protein
MCVTPPGHARAKSYAILPVEELPDLVLKLACTRVSAKENARYDFGSPTLERIPARSNDIRTIGTSGVSCRRMLRRARAKSGSQSSVLAAPCSKCWRLPTEMFSPLSPSEIDSYSPCGGH